MIEQKYADINMPGYLVFEIIDLLRCIHQIWYWNESYYYIESIQIIGLVYMIQTAYTFHIHFIPCAIFKSLLTSVEDTFIECQLNTLHNYIP